MADRRIRYVKLDDLKGNPDNPKGHDLALIGASLDRFGYVEPQTMDERTGLLIAGHGRLEELKAKQDAGEPAPDGVRTRGARWYVPVVYGWASADDDEALAYLVASNESTIAGGWDYPRLAPVLEQVGATSLELVGTGFTRERLDALLDDLRPPEPPAEEPEPAEPGTLPPRVADGDVWRLGPHQLICGDSTAVTLPAADALISDPPYGMGLDTTWYGSSEVGSQFSHIGEVDWDAEPFDPSPFVGGAPTVALFGANYYCTRLPLEGTWWVWDKRTTSDGLGEINFAGGMPYELIWINRRCAHRLIRHLWSGYYRQAGSPDDERHTAHPTQKPVAVMRELIDYLTVGGQHVLDPFGGAGSTLIACDQAGRRCTLIERDPALCDVILDRWERRGGEPADRLDPAA